MDEVNLFGADFLSNGEFHHLYSSFENQDEIFLWDDRADLNPQPKWNCISDLSGNYMDYSPYQVSGYINFVDNRLDEFEPLASSNNHNFASIDEHPQEYNGSTSTANCLTDMDEWKQNHLDDLIYHSSNNNEWELNLDNILMDQASDDSAFNVCDLPARTLYCNDSCTNFLKETSEHLDTSLRTFQPTESKQRIESNIDYKQYLVNSNHDEKEFVCTFGDCRKVYAKAGHLKAHIRRHIGDKPYVCQWPNCTWKFSRSDELSRHRRSHSGIKPYHCDLCPKCFSRSDHLTKHRKVHERKMAAMKIKAIWTKLPPRKPGRKPKGQSIQ